MDFTMGLGGIAEMGMGMLLGGYQDRRQLKQQKQLQELQIAGQKEMGTFNLGLQKDMANTNAQLAQRATDRQNQWNDPSQQVKRLENAGLNVGLAMSPGGGGGGTTSAIAPGGGGSQGGNVTGGTASPSQDIGMAMTLGIQKALAEAEIKLKGAQKDNVDTDTTLKGGQINKTEAETSNIKQNTLESIAKTALAQNQNKAQEIRNNIDNLSTDDQIRQFKANADQTELNIRKGQSETYVQEKTQDLQVDFAKLTNAHEALKIVGQDLQNQNLSQDLKVKFQNIQESMHRVLKMRADITHNEITRERQEQEYQLKKQETEIKRQLQEFTTSAPQQIRQYLGIITDLIPGKK